MIPVPIHILGIDTIQMTDQETYRKIDVEVIPTIETKAIQIIEINYIITDDEIIQTTDQINKDLIITIIKPDYEKIYKVGIQTITIDKETTLNHLKEITHVVQILKNKYRSNRPIHQRQVNQVQTTGQKNSDPPGIDNTETTELQLNHVNCESTDSENDTENTILINMIKVENDYETVTYEQPFHSHIYENQLELLLDYHTRPRSSNIPNKQIVNNVTTLHEPEKEQTPCSSTNHIYHFIPKKPPKEKFWTITFLLESPKSKEFQSPDLEIDFLIDSGAESNIIKFPTWNEIKNLQPKLTPVKTASRLATAPGSTLTNYGKIQLFLVPIKTMEQNKLLSKPFKQTFHSTDIIHKIIGIPFITKYIPTFNILDSKTNVEDKYTRMENTALTFFQRMIKQPPFFFKTLPYQ